MPFTCSICGEESEQICVRCTKDTCANHLCEKCGRCSDCCECELALTGEAVERTAPEAATEVPAASVEPPPQET
jgi:hypothetical protein